MPPIDNTRDMSMLHWIEMNIINVPLQIGVVAYRVFPITTLPNSFLSFDNFAWGSRHFFKATREAALDQAPTGGKIGITLRQSPERVNVVR